MRTLWIAVLVLFLLNLWLMGKIGGLIAQCRRMETAIKASRAGRLLEPDTSDPGSRL
jgi:hypothetical protein